MAKTEQTDSGRGAEAPSPPAAYAIIRKVRGPQGVNARLGGVVVVGGHYTTELRKAAVLTAGERPEFKPLGEEDRKKIADHLAGQKDKKDDNGRPKA